MERRYNSLRIVAGIVRFLGVVTLLIASIGALVGAATLGTQSAVLIGLGGVLSSVFIIAGAESIKVIIDIEENSRHVRHFLKNGALARSDSNVP